MTDNEILANLKHELLCCSLKDDFSNGYSLAKEEQRAFAFEHTKSLNRGVENHD